MAKAARAEAEASMRSAKARQAKGVFWGGTGGIGEGGAGLGALQEGNESGDEGDSGGEAVISCCNVSESEVCGSPRFGEGASSVTPQMERMDESPILSPLASSTCSLGVLPERASTVAWTRVPPIASSSR